MAQRLSWERWETLSQRLGRAAVRRCLLDLIRSYSHELSTVVFVYTRPAQDQPRPYLSMDGESAHQTPLLVEMLTLLGESWFSFGVRLLVVCPHSGGQPYIHRNTNNTN